MQQPEENIMNMPEQWNQTADDPLGLGQLEQVEPGYDGWSQLESALLLRQNNKRRWRRTGGWLAIAASLVLAVSFTVNRPASQAEIPVGATLGPGLASVTGADKLRQENIKALVSLSQNVEAQVKTLRQGTVSMPAESAIYVAELQDLIAQVDTELSLQPSSVDLWGQRVNLLLDLARIYQQQWQIDYSRMASL